MDSQPQDIHYQYSPLPEGPSIRLLSIKSLSEDGILTCSIRTLPSIHDPKTSYSCLSYTWGNPFRDIDKPRVETQHMIDCGTGTLSIGLNLYHALCALLKIAGGRTVEDLWVDAVCICQWDEMEKSSQVAMMHDIYKFAEKVIPWLGPSDRNSDVTTEVIRLLEAHEQAHPGFMASIKVLDEYDARVQAAESLPISPLQWCACRNFLRRTYFQRLWIFQEVVVARVLEPICGDQEMPWSGLMLTSTAWSSIGRLHVRRNITYDETLQSLDPPHTFDSLTELSGHYGSDIFGELIECSTPFQFQYSRNCYFKNGNLASMRYDDMLVINRDMFFCQNPRDRIYAHRGVYGYSNLMPDYSKSVAAVYTEFWSESLLSTGNLNLLTYIEDESCREDREPDDPGQEDYELPSWVPDFHLKMEPRSLDIIYRGKFSISEGLGFEADLTITNQCLSVNGWRIDTIEQFGECRDEFSTRYGISDILRLAISLPQKYPAGGDSMEAVWRTATILKDWDNYPADDDQRELFKDWAKHTLSNPEVHANLKHDENKGQMELLRSLHPSDAFPSVEELEQYIAMLVEFGAGASGVVGLSGQAFGDIAFKKMRLFRTKGYLVGKGPQSMQEGDGVWLFPGAEVPFILRPLDEDKWQFIGQAYVHGVMHGDEFEDMDIAEPERINIV